jgi:hypothetical protein
VGEAVDDVGVLESLIVELLIEPNRSGVEDEEIEGPPGPGPPLGEGADRVEGEEVKVPGFDLRRGVTSRSDRLDGGIGLLLIPAGEDDVNAGSSEREGRLVADARVRARHDRSLAL